MKMLALLRPKVGRTVLAPPPIDRSRDPGELSQPGDIVCETIEQGLMRARDIAPERGVVLVTGSIFTVGPARALILQEPTDPPIGF